MKSQRPISILRTALAPLATWQTVHHSAGTALAHAFKNMASLIFVGTPCVRPVAVKRRESYRRFSSPKA